MLRIVLVFIIFALVVNAKKTGVILSTEGEIALYLAAFSIVVWEAYSFWYFHNEKFLKIKTESKITP